MTQPKGEHQLYIRWTPHLRPDYKARWTPCPRPDFQPHLWSDLRVEI